MYRINGLKRTIPKIFQSFNNYNYRTASTISKKINNNTEAINNKIDIEELKKKVLGDGTNGELVNSLRSLPRIDLIKDKEEIKREILSKREDKTEKGYDNIIIYYKKAKNLVLFFKEGFLNIWKVNKDLRENIFNGQRYIIDYSKGNEKDGKLIIKRGDYEQLIEELAERVSLLNIEFKNNLGNNNFNYNNRNEIFINRKEFIEIVRDKQNFIKLPISGLLFLVLEEMSLLIFYFFPQLLPGTCVLPGKLENKYYDKHHSGLTTLKNRRGGEEDKMRTYLQEIAMNKISAYSIKREDLSFICHSLICRNCSIKALHLHQMEIIIDDYLLLSSGGISSLSLNELVYGCRIRGLNITSIDSNIKINTEKEEILREQLERWLINRILL